MRHSGRRRPAGTPQVPVSPVMLMSSRPDELVVWRTGPDRQVWELTAPAVTMVASIWLAGEPAAWRRAFWPYDANGVAVAPLDLNVGHVVELCTHGQAAITVRYACVIDIAPDTVVVLVASACDRALQASALIASTWCDARINDAWEHLGRP